MRQPKLSGREIALLRAIGFSEPVAAEDILNISQLVEEDAIDVLNGLMVVGYVESSPPRESITAETFRTMRFEVNPSYVLQLREIVTRRF